MRVINLLVVLLLTSSYSAGAREATLLNFKARSEIHSDLGDGVSAIVPHELISQSLRNHFADSLPGGEEPFSVGDGFRSSHPPTMRPTDFRIPHQIIQNSCDGAYYSPAWWLPRDVEVRRASLFKTVASIACEFGLPTRLLDAVIAHESGYNPWAISSAGAMGIMQIMPGTARSLGLATPFDTLLNMRAGARYLRQQLDRFGRVDLALAAYNAGPERRSLRRGFVPAIPETLNYVRTITTNWARLVELEPGQTDTTDRTYAALSAVHASGYRDVELIRYDGLNRANPM